MIISESIRLNYNNIPQELTKLTQWVCYRLEHRKDEDKPVKVPINFNGGARAKSDNPSTWGTFEQCLIASKRYNGIGFIVSETDPYTVIDLDACVTRGDDNQPNIEPWAWKIIHDLDSYAEFSQSGKGIHIIIQAKKPGPRCRSNEHPHIEIYDHRRFLVMTGNLVPGITPIIQPAPNEISELYNRLFGQAALHDRSPHQKPSQRAHTASGGPSDSELIERAMSAKNGLQFSRLWNGDLSDYNYDWSAADQALCNTLAFWTGKDYSAIDRLFRQSGLMRDKWDREDYRNRTIQRAIDDTRECYRPTILESVSAEEIAEVRKASDKIIAEREQRKSNRPGNNSPNQYHQTDYGNAERLVDAYGSSIRFDCDSSRWLIWLGTRWAEDATGEIERMMKSTIRDIYSELPTMDDSKIRDALYKHASKSEANARIKAALSLAQTELGIPLISADLDADSWMFNVANGTVDLRTGQLHPHTQTHLITKQSPVKYDPNADCPSWQQFLLDVTQSDDELISFLQRAIGYSLTGDTREQIFFILYGYGSNGKSTLLSIVREIIGTYSMQTSTDTILERNNSGIPNDLARLRGARMVAAVEAKAGRRLAEDLIKQITGGDPITARFLRAEFFEFVPQFKLWLACNHQPRIEGMDEAIWRRIRLIPFKVQFKDADAPEGPYKDLTLLSKLQSELPGILNWAIQGCLDWQQNGIGKPRAMIEATGKYQQSMDVLGQFLSERCVIMPQATVLSKELYGDYCKWCEGMNERPMSHRKFSVRLDERGLFERYISSGQSSWRGLGLVTNDLLDSTSEKPLYYLDEE